MRDAALHFVLAADEVTGGKLGNERVSRTALGAEALGESGLPSRPRPTGLLHSGLPQNRLPSGTCGSASDRRGRITPRDARDGDDPGAEAATGAGGLRRPGAGRPR